MRQAVKLKGISEEFDDRAIPVSTSLPYSYVNYLDRVRKQRHEFASISAMVKYALSVAFPTPNGEQDEEEFIASLSFETEQIIEHKKPIVQAEPKESKKKEKEAPSYEIHKTENYSLYVIEKSGQVSLRIYRTTDDDFDFDSAPDKVHNWRKRDFAFNSEFYRQQASGIAALWTDKNQEPLSDVTAEELQEAIENAFEGLLPSS